MHPRGVELARRDIEVARGVVERRLADVALRLQVAIALELLSREPLVGLGLDERVLRCQEADLAQLPQLRLALRDRGLRLRDRGTLVAIVELDQDVAAPNRLALGRPECA